MIDKKVIRQRLLARVQKDKLTKCWIYCGAWDKRGGARMRIGYKTYTIRRVAAWLFKGVELWDNCLRYRICTNPACCNPSHIRIAQTVAQVFADLRKRKVASPKRSKNVLPSTRRCIKWLIKNGVSPTKIAEDTGLSPITIHRANRK